MLLPAYTTTNASLNTDTSTTFIPCTANLKITLNMQSQPKSKRQTKYRPIERPDGVIVLQRPYRPATSPPQQFQRFEKHVPTFTVPKASVKLRSIAAVKRTEDDLVCVGSQFAESGRDGYNDLADAGRSGYNDVAEAREVKYFLKDFRRGGQDLRGLPMQRYLGEEGSWSEFAMRDS